MPPAIIAAVIGAAMTATTTGLQLSGAFTPDSPKTPKPGTTPLTQGQNDQQKAMVGQQLPNLQSMTGGSLSPEYAAQFGALQSGLGNDPQASGNVQAAINQFFGLTAPGTSGFTSGSTGGGSGGGSGILDMLSKSSPQSMPKPPGGGGDFVNETLSGDIFKGLTG